MASSTFRLLRMGSFGLRNVTSRFTCKPTGESRIPLSVALGSHTRQVGTAHKCARSSLAMLDTVSRHSQWAKQKDHRVMAFFQYIMIFSSTYQDKALYMRLTVFRHFLLSIQTHPRDFPTLFVKAY